ncbi:hypothetical protein DUNSADRAFT_14143 [Dunaliella salina]|uniref:Transmembrane protein n=1 Tax=Dunaliella salina TaxID=3046 RepID=A0ABQ7H2Q9_DUNSA|nr:hypothetical protein DUNSADRAFT_14143 [Dunaliella salina]|eukprot:KAF5841140.1 hypothetical protein DUNSADRAFT_14143 [Dunaliella salina]
MIHDNPCLKKCRILHRARSVMESKLQVASPPAFPLQKLTLSAPSVTQQHCCCSNSNINNFIRFRRNVVLRASAGDVYNIVSKPAIAASRTTEFRDDEQSGPSRQLSSALPNANQGAPGRSAQKAFSRAASTLTRFGWLGFMLQLILTLASSILLVFEVAFTPRNGPTVALYLVLLGIAAGLASIASNFKYVRMGAQMRNALLGRRTKEPIRKGAVLGMVARGVVINCLGLGLALMAMQALVAQLLMQPLAMPEGLSPMMSGHSSPDALLSSLGSLSAQTIDPYLTLDVFLFQSASNMLLSHFLSLVCSLWLLSAVGRGHTARVQKLLTLRKNKKQGNAPAASDDKVVISKGNAARYIIDPTQIGSGAADGENDTPAGSTSRSTLFSGSDISSALASALRSARARNHPWTEPVSTVASTEDPMAAWFMDGGEALNTAGRASGIISSPEAEDMLDPLGLGLWDPTPPLPMNGKGPQWGSKIRVSCEYRW